jgi:hypothetical protein
LGIIKDSVKPWVVVGTISGKNHVIGGSQSGIIRTMINSVLDYYAIIHSLFLEE